MEEKIEIRMHEDVYDNTTGIAIFQIVDGKRFIAKPLEFVEHETMRMVTPTLKCSKDFGIIEQLKENLRRMGYLNNADQATNNALKYHLEDMRSLVFKKSKPITMGEKS